MVSAGPVWTPVPSEVRISFAHAAAQWLADASGVDLIHIKGAALDASQRHPGRSFTDADVLVRPDQADAFVAELVRHGWLLQTSFDAGSSTGHSATLHHDVWGYLDLHREYPGFGPTAAEAFTTMWADRQVSVIGGVACAVPDVPTQALVVLLHAARSHGFPRGGDVEHLWTSAAPGARADVLRAVDRYDAHVGFSVIQGRLEEHRDHPTYGLWKVWSEGGTRLDEWRARLRAETSWRGRLAVLRRAPMVNLEHLEVVRGRPLTRREVTQEFFGRLGRGLAQEARRRLGRDGGGSR